MKSIITTIAGIIIGGIVVLLCFFSCVASQIADEYWEKVREDLENEDDRQ